MAPISLRLAGDPRVHDGLDWLAGSLTAGGYAEIRKKHNWKLTVIHHEFAGHTTSFDFKLAEKRGGRWVHKKKVKTNRTNGFAKCAEMRRNRYSSGLSSMNADFGCDGDHVTFEANSLEQALALTCLG